MSGNEEDPKEEETTEDKAETPDNKPDAPVTLKEKPASTKVYTPRQIRRRALLEKVNELKPKLLKLYKHKGFPRAGVQALTVDRVLRNLKLDEKDDLNRRAVGFAWHELYDEKEVAVPQFWRPPDDDADKLPF